MSTYQWKGAGYGLPMNTGGRIFKKVDVPALIAAGAFSGLALVAAPDTGVALASTGFAADDILEIFWVPKGTMVKQCGVYTITGEGATCTINAGVTSATETEDGTDIDGWGIFSIQTSGATDATTDATGADAFGNVDVPGGVLYITDGSIDIEFNHATDAAIFVFWADVAWIDIV